MKKLFALHLLTALLLLLSACDNTAGGTMESGAPAPHSSTNQSVNEQASSQAPQEQTDTATSQITRERAVEIALEKATLKKEDVHGLEAELDYEKGVLVWEVDFDYKNYDYSYYINAQTGAIAFEDIEKDYD